jgi:two-component system, sensor histidine kinase and response regulator
VKLLLVDDDAGLRALLRTTFELVHVDVEEAESAKAALENIASRRPDVIVLDVQMPGMDGIETTLTIRADEKISGGRVPVMAFTAHATVADRERCLRAGMDGYLTKPIRPTELLDALERRIGPPTRSMPPVKRVVLDRAALLERVDGDRKLLSEVAGLFLGEYARLLTDARDALARRDRPDFSAAMHTLRGMLRSLSADEAQQIAGMLQALDPENDRDKLAATFDLLEHEVDSLKTELLQLASEAAA